MNQYSKHHLRNQNENQKIISNIIYQRIDQILGGKKNKKILFINFTNFPDLIPENSLNDYKFLSIKDVDFIEIIRRRINQKNWNWDNLNNLSEIISGYINDYINKLPIFKFKVISTDIQSKYLQLLEKPFQKFGINFLPPKRKLESMSTVGIFDLILLQVPLGINDKLFNAISTIIFDRFLNDNGYGLNINTWKTFVDIGFRNNINETKDDYKEKLKKKKFASFHEFIFRNLVNKNIKNIMLPIYRYRENILGAPYKPFTGVEMSLFEFKRQKKEINNIISCDFRPVINKKIKYKEVEIVSTPSEDFRDAKISLIQNKLIKDSINKKLKYYILENCSKIFQIHLQSNKDQTLKKISELENIIFIPTIPSLKNLVETNYQNLKDWWYWCALLDHKILNAEFVAEYLNSVNGKDQLMNLSRGSTIKHLNNSAIKKLLIVNRLIEKQKEKVRDNKQIDEIIKKLESLKDLNTDKNIDFDPDLLFEKMPKINLKKILSKDETVKHEYKSTLRININTNQPDDKITLSALKTIVAFLNTKGGNLIIGIADDKALVGISKDRFKNIDEWQRFLKDKIKKSIGVSFLETYIHTAIHLIDNDEIAIIKCDKLPTDETAFLDGSVYVRQGPATSALNHKEMLEWSKKRTSSKNK